MICEKDFLKLQKLSRLSVNSEDKEKFLHRFNKSFNEVSRINDIDAKIYDSINNFVETGHNQRLSEDIAQNLVQKDVISNAPKIEKHLGQRYFSVSKVIK